MEDALTTVSAPRKLLLKNANADLQSTSTSKQS